MECSCAFIFVIVVFLKFEVKWQSQVRSELFLIKIVSMSQSYLLMKELQVLKKYIGVDQPDYVCYQLHYQLNCKRPQYLQNLKAAFASGLQATQLSQFGKCCSYLSYLVNFQLNVSYELQDLRSVYLCNCYGGMQTSMNGLKYLSMLMVVQGSQALFQLKDQLDRHDVSEDEVIKLLVVLKKKLDWQLQKKRMCMKTVGENMNDLTQQIILFLIDKKDDQNDLVVSCKINLTAKLFAFMGMDLAKHGRQKDLKAMVLKLLEIKPVSLQKNSQQFQMLENVIAVFGSFEQSKIMAFILSNIICLQNVCFLKMIQTYLNRLQPNAQSKQFLMSLFQSLFKVLFNKSNDGMKQTFARKVLINDLIVKISGLTQLDFNKLLTRLFGHMTNLDFQAVLHSLRKLFYQAIPVQLIQNLSIQQQKIYQSSPYQKDYEQMLSYYGNSLDIDNFVSNPQMMQNFMWHMLVMRNTMVTSLQNVFDQRIKDLFFNLVRLVMADIYANQCVITIRSILINMKNEERKLEGSQSWAMVLKEISNHILENNRNQNYNFDLLEQIMSNFQENIALDGVQNMQVFFELVHLGQIIVCNQTLSYVFMTYFSNLLYLSMPDQFTDCDTQLLLQCSNILFQIFNRTEHKQICTICIILISTTQHITLVRQNFLRLRVEMERLCLKAFQHQNIPAQIYRCLQIEMYIIGNREYRTSLVNQFWTDLFEMDQIYHSDYYNSIFNVFNYFHACLLRNHIQQGDQVTLSSFYQWQIRNSIAFLDVIHAKTDSAILLRDVKHYLMLQQTLAYYLYSNLREYQKLEGVFCDQLLGNIQKLINEMRDQIKLANSYKENRVREKQEIFELRCNTLKPILLMIPLILRISPPSSQNKIDGICMALRSDQKWLMNAMGQPNKAENIQFSLLLQGELIGLEIMYSYRSK